MDLAHENLTTKEIKYTLLLATINEGNTAWHLAALKANTVALQKILDLSKGSLTKQEIKNTLLLATNKEGNTAWHLAALKVNTVALQ
jgi:ankyrin repeat protein